MKGKTFISDQIQNLIYFKSCTEQIRLSTCEYFRVNSVLLNCNEMLKNFNHKIQHLLEQISMTTCKNFRLKSVLLNCNKLLKYFNHISKYMYSIYYSKDWFNVGAISASKNSTGTYDNQKYKQ